MSETSGHSMSKEQNTQQRTALDELDDLLNDLEGSETGTDGGNRDAGVGSNGVSIDSQTTPSDQFEHPDSNGQKLDVETLAAVENAAHGNNGENSVINQEPVKTMLVPLEDESNTTVGGEGQLSQFVMDDAWLAKVTKNLQGAGATEDILIQLTSAFEAGDKRVAFNLVKNFKGNKIEVNHASSNPIEESKGTVNAAQEALPVDQHMIAQRLQKFEQLVVGSHFMSLDGNKQEELRKIIREGGADAAQKLAEAMASFSQADYDVKAIHTQQLNPELADINRIVYQIFDEPKSSEDPEPPVLSEDDDSGPFIEDEEGDTPPSQGRGIRGKWNTFVANLKKKFNGFSERRRGAAQKREQERADQPKVEAIYHAIHDADGVARAIQPMNSTKAQEVRQGIRDGSMNLEDFSWQDICSMLITIPPVVAGVGQVTTCLDALGNVPRDELNTIHVPEVGDTNLIELTRLYLQLRTEGPKMDEIMSGGRNRGAIGALLLGVRDESRVGGVRVTGGVAGLIKSGVARLKDEIAQEKANYDLWKKIRRAERSLKNNDITEEQKAATKNQIEAWKKQKLDATKDRLKGKKETLLPEAEKMREEIIAHLPSDIQAVLKNPESDDNKKKLDEWQAEVESTRWYKKKPDITAPQAAALLLTNRIGETNKIGKLFYKSEDTSGFSLLEIAELKKRERMVRLVESGDIKQLRNAQIFHTLEKALSGLRVGLDKDGVPKLRLNAIYRIAGRDKKEAWAKGLADIGGKVAIVALPWFPLAKAGAVALVKGSEYGIKKIHERGENALLPDSKLARGLVSVADALSRRIAVLEQKTSGRLGKAVYQGAVSGATSMSLIELTRFDDLLIDVLKARDALNQGLVRAAAVVGDSPVGPGIDKVIDAVGNTYSTVAEESHNFANSLDWRVTQGERSMNVSESPGATADLLEANTPEESVSNVDLAEAARINDGVMPNVEATVTDQTDAVVNGRTSVQGSDNVGPTADRPGVGRPSNLRGPDEVTSSTGINSAVDAQSLNGTDTTEQLVQQVEKASSKLGTQVYVPQPGDTASAYFSRAFDKIPALENNVFHPGGVNNALSHLQEHTGSGTFWIAGQDTQVLSDTVIEHVTEAMEKAYWEVHKFGKNIDPETVEKALKAGKITQEQALLLQIGPGIEGTDIADFTATNKFKELAQDLIEKAAEDSLLKK